MGKVGLGYFLVRKSDFTVTGNLWTATSVATTFSTEMAVDSSFGTGVTETLNILDYISLDINAGTDSLLVLCTAERKHELTTYTCTRSYNMIDMFDTYTPQMFEAPNTLTVVPMSLQAILEDILDIAGWSGDFTNFDEPPQPPVNVLVGGMSVLCALEYICRAYGILMDWDYTTDSVIFYQDLSQLDATVSFSDRQQSIITSNLRCDILSVNFPELKVAGNTPLFHLNQEQADTFYQVDEDFNKPGPHTNVYFPFAYKNPAIDPYPDNTSLLLTLFNWLRDQYRNLLTYYENRLTIQRYFRSNYRDYRWFSCIFKDNGEACGTIYKSEPFPWITEPTELKLQLYRTAEIVSPSGTVPGRVGVTPGTGSAAWYKWVYNGGNWDLDSGGAVIVYNIGESDVGPGYTTAVWVGDKLVLTAGQSSSPVVVTFTLTENLAYSAGAEADATVGSIIAGTTSGLEEGDPIVVYSLGARRSKVGCVGIGIRAPDGRYLVLELQQMALFVKGTLKPLGGSGTLAQLGAFYNIATVEVENAVSLTPYEFNFIDTSKIGTGITQSNRFRLNGNDGDNCILQYDAATDEYFLIAVYPLQARRIIAELTQDRLPGCPAGFEKDASITATPTYSFDGPLPPSASFSVYDTFNIAIAAKDGDLAYCEWNHELQKYQIIELHRRARMIMFKSTTDWCPNELPTIDSTSCTLYGFDGEPFFDATTLGANIDNPLGIPGMENDQVVAVWNPTSKKYSILVKSYNEITDIRIEGYEFQYRKGDDCPWEPWHIGTDCETIPDPDPEPTP
jgi:hypothetical protein